MPRRITKKTCTNKYGNELERYDIMQDSQGLEIN